MMKKIRGFTLIELIIFIVLTAIVAATIFLPVQQSYMNASKISNQYTANLLAQQCMEWLLGNRLLNGYTALACPSTPTGVLCNSSGDFTITPSVTCTTLGSDTNFKTISVVVSGNGNATLISLIAKY